MIYDAIIIGGGAAGLFCAIEAGKRGKRVLVIEDGRILERGSHEALMQLGGHYAGLFALQARGYR